MEATEIIDSIRNETDHDKIKILCNELDGSVVDFKDEIRALKEDVSEKQDQINDLQTDIDNLQDEVNELESRPEGNPFYDTDKESLEDARKSEMLKDHWEYFTTQQLERFLRIIGRNI